MNVGQVDNLRGGWLPPPAGCRRDNGPIDNRPQVDNLPHIDSPGVILIRFPTSARRMLAEAVLKLVCEYASQPVGAFVVLRPGAARISFGPHHPQ
jgi:hypothetical protein